MDLELDLDEVRVPAAEPVAARVVRDLTLADLEVAGHPASSPQPVPQLKRLHSRHHALARVLSRGDITDKDAAILCGYTPQMVVILRKDSAFQELIEHYSVELDEVSRGLPDALLGIAKDAVDELGRRVEEEAEKLSVGQLLEIAKLGADRTGHGPQTSSTQNVNVNIGIADRLSQARKRVREAKIIDAKAVEVVADEPQT